MLDGIGILADQERREQFPHRKRCKSACCGSDVAKSNSFCAIASAQLDDGVETIRDPPSGKGGLSIEWNTQGSCSDRFNLHHDGLQAPLLFEIDPAAAS